MEWLWMHLFELILMVGGFAFLWNMIDQSRHNDSMSRRKIDYENAKKIETFGNEINLLNLRHKALAAKQSRRVDIHLHDESPKPKPKGQGKEALIPRVTQ